MTEEGASRAASDDAETRSGGGAAQRLLEALLDHCSVASSLRVLDVGVGPGQASLPFLDAGARVVGLDVSASRLEGTRAQHPAFHVLLEHDLARGFPTQLRPDDADVVIACGVLHRVEASRSALCVLARALAPGGVVAFTYVPPGTTSSTSDVRCDPPEDIEAAMTALGWRVLVHDTITAYRDEATDVIWGRVVARDPRPSEPVPEALQTLDRTACVDRARVLTAFRRTPWRASDHGDAVGDASGLLDAVRDAVSREALDLRALPWPALRGAAPSAAARCEVLAILPHPDDESVYAGGTIAGMVDAGRRVHLAVATDGGGGRGGPDLCRCRMQELLTATAALGIQGVECLGWSDFGKYRDPARMHPVTLVDTLRVWGLDRSIRDVVACIRRHRPRVLLSLDPEVDPNYSLHGHHLALGLLVAVGFHLAADPAWGPQLGEPWAALEHRVMAPPAEAQLGEVFEIDRERKRAALSAHASQGYSTQSLVRALADRSRPAVEVSRRMQVRRPDPSWLARAQGPRIDQGVDWEAEAQRVLRCSRRRPELVEVLAGQAQDRPHDAAVDRSIERLADPRTVAVVTGQQVGLLGGPALTLYKALAAVALAERITAAGVEAVPVFWMATHDHDLDEVRTVPRLDGEPLRLAVEHAGRAVGDLRLGEAIGPLLRAWIRAVDPPQTLASLLRSCYGSDETFASAFARFLAHLTRGTGLVLLDPNDPRMAALAQPVLERELLGPQRVDEPLARRRQELLADGRHEVIDTTREVLQLFITDDDGRRRRLRPTASGVAWPGGELHAHAAAALLARSPGRFTPAALLRPLVQDAVLPTIAYVAGPTEARYLEQLVHAYPWADLPMPRIVRRPSLLASTHADTRALLGVGSREVLASREDPEAAIGRAGLPPSARRWLDQLDAVVAGLAAQRGGSFDRAALLDACGIDASAAVALAGCERVLPTWGRAMQLVGEIPSAGSGAPPARSLTRALRGFSRVQRALLREGRRAQPTAMAAWRRMSPRPTAPERRASVAEVIARLGPDAPRAILAALRRNLVADVVVQGEESS